MWLTAAQKYRKHIHVPQGQSSQRTPYILLYGVEIEGLLFFIINDIEVERDRERYRDSGDREREREREVYIYIDRESEGVRERER